MKKFLPFIIAMMICLCSARAYAATGELQLVLPEEASGMTIHYTKVAEREELNEEKAKELLQNDRVYDESINVSEGGDTVVENLEEGIYQVWVSGDEEFEFAPMLVSIPAWDEEEGKMNYHVTVNPKYIRNIPEPEIPDEPDVPEPAEITPQIPSPETGDASRTGAYAAFGIISFIIVLIMTCHNRFKCGRMSK